MSLTVGAAETWIRRFHPTHGAAVRLVCLPHAGGAASYWFPLSAALQPGVEVLSIQYPGRQDRRLEPCIEDIGTLADQLTEVLLAESGPPPALFGHSMGAVIAFEVARRLEKHGTGPEVLFASGRRAPACHRAEDVHVRGTDGIVAELRLLDGTDSRALADTEILRRILPAVRADFKALETYRYQPGPPLRCEIRALVGDRDPKVTVEEAQAWHRHTSGGFGLYVMGGGHFFLNEHWPQIVKLITRDLVSPGHLAS